jgi:hypothetical protein
VRPVSRGTIAMILEKSPEGVTIGT